MSQIKDTIIFNGIAYTRRPGSKINSDRMYYRCSPHNVKKGHENRLHRAIYLSVHGHIPCGYVVHHLNGNPLDNGIDNLGLMPKSDHGKLHGSTPEHIARLNESRTLVMEWQKNHPEQVAKMAGHAGKTYWTNPREPVEVFCTVCGTAFLNKAAHNKALFCSEKCRVEHYTEQRICQFCQKAYFVHKNSDNKYCSRKCFVDLLRKRKAAKVSLGGS